MTGLFLDPRIDQRLIALLLLRRLLPLALEYNACAHSAASGGQPEPMTSFADRRRNARAAYGLPTDDMKPLNWRLRNAEKRGASLGGLHRTSQ